MKKTMIVLALCSSLLLLNACGNTNKDTEPETAATEVTTVAEDTTEAATEEETAEGTAEESTAEAETAEAETDAEGADDAENAEEATDAENEEDGAEVAETAAEEEAAA